MNKMTTLLIGTGFVLMTSVGFATAVTSLDKGWMCKTNASSSDVEADKMADKEMGETAKSAADSYAFAAKHCRDCTKITCEVND